MFDPVDSILMSQPEFLEEMLRTKSYLQRITYPRAVRKLRAHTNHGLFTWARFPHEPRGVVSMLEWTSEEGRLWIVDWVPIAGTDVRTVAKWALTELVVSGVASEGEKVHIWRHRTQRYGSFTARDYDGRTIQARQF